MNLYIYIGIAVFFVIAIMTAWKEYSPESFRTFWSGKMTLFRRKKKSRRKKIPANQPQPKPWMKSVKIALGAFLCVSGIITSFVLRFKISPAESLNPVVEYLRENRYWLITLGILAFFAVIAFGLYFKHRNKSEKLRKISELTGDVGKNLSEKAMGLFGFFKETSFKMPWSQIVKFLLTASIVAGLFFGPLILAGIGLRRNIWDDLRGTPAAWAFIGLIIPTVAFTYFGKGPKIGAAVIMIIIYSMAGETIAQNIQAEQMAIRQLVGPPPNTDPAKLWRVERQRFNRSTGKPLQGFNPFEAFVTEWKSDDSVISFYYRYEVNGNSEKAFFFWDKTKNPNRGYWYQNNPRGGGEWSLRQVAPGHYEGVEYSGGREYVIRLLEISPRR